MGFVDKTLADKNSPRGEQHDLGRRDFLRSILAAGGFVLAAKVLPEPASAAVLKTGADAMPHGTVNDPHVFITIDSSGKVTIIAARAEMGTGAARTSLPMIIADELEADWNRVTIQQGYGDEAHFGNQDTDGSRSVRHFLTPMRQVGAAMRAMLVAAAAKRWNVPVSEVRAENHQVLHVSSSRRLSYGDLADDLAKIPVPPAESLTLKTQAEFRYIGKGQIGMVDLHNITTGHASYGIDTRLPGMKYAVITRPPVVGGKLVSFDATETLKVPGVEKVLEVQGWPWPSKFQPLGGVAVIARNTGSAIKGREALKVTWDDGPNASYDSELYQKELTATAQKPGLVVRNDGDVEAAFKSAAKVVSADYYLPHLAHVTMEPPCATALVANGKCEVWAPVQSPGNTFEELVKTLGLPPEAVKVNVTLLGGGFGRKSKCDYALEAALLSRDLGVPVKVVWTREDDVQHDFYHTVSAEHLEAAVDAQGKVTAWRHRSVAPSIGSTFGPGQKHEIPIELGMGFTDLPYAIPNIRCENGEAAAHTRIGWFRSVSNIPHGFAVQSFTAELAHALGRDPKDFLLELIGPARIVDPRATAQGFWDYGEPFESYPIDTGRLRHVVELVAEKAGWGRPLPKGHGLGIAVHRSFVSYIATVVEVAVDEKGNFTVPRVDTAVDCGAFVNPERIRSQTEGAAVMGLSLAKYGALTFKNGRAEQANFDDFRVVRIDEAPGVTHTHIVDKGFDVPPGGVGEPGVPPFAPALCNAIFAATGKRLRQMPIGDQLAI
ncbi:xanthine dehydrogenase family protein molybdopterin-binding subunit [Beijerinckia indica]|uniref:Aldehyde oxidase and xanthine dehydrogenase molybdopterin binding n=1 Tax=Beijerinckia indica subsp. indica (strain ATCC 9039 / DSM 1715 / NCIMB 8712) TaxID=395963 RepID=B2IKU7_BEII9|nr:molybdopterin cofactor-binding domain-containing protein [Beijerinckia indica]ACB96487.1 aldehyde oxidase and xanthine dehydrogenase molybdopterin binding [Beijerinckia indica subsp. indica ATCC 9039]